MMIRSKLDGTMAGQFSIGKRGPTIRQGSLDPNSNALFGISGDLYVRVGDAPSLYQFGAGKWKVIGLGGAAGGKPLILEVDVTTSGEQVVSVPNGYAFYKWSRNGVGQRGTSVVATPSSVTIPASSNLVNGDFFTVEFLPSVTAQPWVMIEFDAAATGQQNVEIPDGYAFFKWSRNGIGQRSSGVMSSGDTLTISSQSGIITGDYITVEFIAT